MIIFGMVAGVALVLITLRRPYLGIVFTATSLPVADVLPKIPLVSSIVPLIGAVTLLGFLLNRKKEPGNRTFRFSNVHIFSALFVVWMFISNPQAAWLGRDRNWIFTFFQLLVLTWLAGELLDSPEKHYMFMWCFSFVTVVSALIAIYQGSLGSEFDPTLRVEGLAQGANTAARYFVVAMVFLNYLRLNTINRFMRLLLTAGVVATFLGVFITGSRTGMLLLFAALGLLVLLQPQLKYRFQFVIVFIAGLVVLWFLSDDIVDILRSIIPSITGGTDTVGLRYAFWKAGWRMWLDNPIAGVGIGMYRFELGKYAQDLIAPRYWYSVTHNMYIQVLAETGTIGFSFFIILLIKSLQNIWQARNTDDKKNPALRNAWIVVFLVMLLGGITKSDHADKMIWLVMGVSVYFYNQHELSTQKNISDQAAKDIQAYRGYEHMVKRQ